jgi:hypothetical protein
MTHWNSIGHPFRSRHRRAFYERPAPNPPIAPLIYNLTPAPPAKETDYTIPIAIALVILVFIAARIM